MWVHVGIRPKMTAQIGKAKRKTSKNGVTTVSIPYENAQGKFEVTIDNCGLSMMYEGRIIIHVIHDALFLHEIVEEETKLKETLKFRIVEKVD
jgi:hypothetical protein